MCYNFVVDINTELWIFYELSFENGKIIDVFNFWTFLNPNRGLKWGWCVSQDCYFINRYKIGYGLKANFRVVFELCEKMWKKIEIIHFGAILSPYQGLVCVKIFVLLFTTILQKALRWNFEYS